MTSADGEEKERKARVIYDYVGDEDNQLTITTGQIITLIGDVTPENWILAKTKTGREGYIPDGYFEVMPDTPKKKKKAKGLKFTPNMSKIKSTSAGAYESHDDPDGDDGMILEQNDTYSLFTYQLEWFAIPSIFLGALFSFMYSTPQVTFDKWRLGVCSWLTFIIVAILAYICGFDRNRFKIKESSTIVRFIFFLMATILLYISYPVGIASAIIGTVTCIAEIRLYLLKPKDLPKKITDEWCSVMFGGTENCPPVKLIIFFVFLAVDGGMFGWGYMDGYNFALDENDEFIGRYLQPIANAFMWGFGRVITINLCLILFLACKDCLCSMFEFLGQKCRKKKKKGGGKEMDVDIFPFMHRCMGYGIVISTFLHLICVYFTYEDSGSTHTFMDTYGWETFGTGWFLILLLSSVVGSSNDTLSKQNKRLFHQTHWQSFLLIIVLIMHGKSFISTYYWQLIIVPLIFYSCHLCVRYLKQGRGN